MKKQTQKKIAELQATKQKFEQLKAEMQPLLDRQPNDRYYKEYMGKYNSLLTRVNSAIEYFQKNG
jgi:predicted Zn-dependent protease